MKKNAKIALIVYGCLAAGSLYVVISKVIGYMRGEIFEDRLIKLADVIEPSLILVFLIGLIALCVWSLKRKW